MDTARSIGSDLPEAPDAADGLPRPEPRLDQAIVGADERRMHVRAYNFWVSLLAGRPFPLLDAFDPAEVSDFGDHGVLIDFTDGAEDPAIRFLGEALRAEGGMKSEVARISEVPQGTLLTRLIAPYPQIVADCAPAGFEAEFVNVRGNNTLYRGILLPFSSDGSTIDHVYGVINWKEMAITPDALLLTQAQRATADEPARPLARHGAQTTAWADGPSSRLLAPDREEEGDGGDAPLWTAETLDDPAAAAGCGGILAHHLAAARGTIGQLHSADLRARSALYRALGLAYDFSCAALAERGDIAAMLADARIRHDPRAPMAAIVRLIFGADYDRSRLTDFAAVLSHGHRLNLPSGGLRRMLEGCEGGLKAIVAAERAARRADPRPAAADTPRETLRRARAAATIKLPEDGGDEEFVLVLARRTGKGRLAVLAPVPADTGLIDRAIRRLPR
jgi:hypothetical protein